MGTVLALGTGASAYAAQPAAGLSAAPAPAHSWIPERKGLLQKQRPAGEESPRAFPLQRLFV